MVSLARLGLFAAFALTLRSVFCVRLLWELAVEGGKSSVSEGSCAPLPQATEASGYVHVGVMTWGGEHACDNPSPGQGFEKKLKKNLGGGD